MSGWAGISVLMLTCGAPLPSQPRPEYPPLDRNQALLFAGRVVQLAYQVADQYVRPVEVQDLLEAALRALYEEAGVVCPAERLEGVRRARTASEFSETLAEARVALGQQDSLRGPRALFAALNGFRRVTDPHTVLVSPRVTTFVSLEMDFGMGMELEGTTGPRWTLYQVEQGFASGRFPMDPAIGSVDMPTPPLGFPWRVRRVIPGSPCQKAGLLPEDIVTHLDGKLITAENSPNFFRELASQSSGIDPTTGQVRPTLRRLTVRRAGVPEPLTLTVKAGPYQPETVFGVRRVSEDSWDHFLDREWGIGYIRVGAIESDTDAKVAEVMADLLRKNCQALILDLRWSPGGFVDPGARLAGLFLDDGALVTRMEDRSAARTGMSPEVKASTPAGWPKWGDRPLVVLVGPETAGGGEMIAAALQDHRRAVIVGQRTVGKGNVQRTFPAQLGDLQFKVSTGYSLRPNGKNRHRFPDSQPTDDWGVRPDVGLEVPMTPALLSELRKSAERHALRPFSSREALDFDDPNRDPYRVMALRYLEKRLRDEKP